MVEMKEGLRERHGSESCIGAKRSLVSSIEVENLTRDAMMVLQVIVKPNGQAISTLALAAT